MIFSGNAGTDTGEQPPAGGGQPPPSTEQPNANLAAQLNAALSDAQAAYERGQAALRDGDFAAYGTAQKDLAAALQRRGDDVRAGLQDFAAGRRPGSDDFQESAIKSILWYENVASIFHLDPLAFAYSYFRRTGKISHEDLRRMDPAFIAAYEAAHGVP